MVNNVFIWTHSLFRNKPESMSKVVWTRSLVIFMKCLTVVWGLFPPTHQQPLHGVVHPHRVGVRESTGLVARWDKQLYFGTERGQDHCRVQIFRGTKEPSS